MLPKDYLGAVLEGWLGAQLSTLSGAFCKKNALSIHKYIHKKL
jgi:hypothetical protein